MASDKRTAILRAAEEMVKGRRFHEVTMEDVARAAHVSKGTLYTYFRDKEELFFQLATEGFDELCEILGGPASEDVPFETRLLNVCRQISSFFRKRKPLMRVMREQEGRTAGLRRQMFRRWKEKRLRLVGVVAEVLQAGASQRRVRGDLPVEALTEMLLGMLRARGRRLDEDDAELLSVENVVAIFLNGAGSAGARAPRGEET
jgi:AcrR family transcriptional regulator